MRCALLAAALTLTAPTVAATDRWEFSERVAVTGAARSGIFHHLEGAGRKHIAAGDNAIAVTWEDNSSGAPQVYATLRGRGDAGFAPALKLSTGSEAYEPAITAIDSDRFVAVWEQDGSVYARSLTSHALGAPRQFSSLSSGQASVAALDNDIFAVWREQHQRRWNLVVARLRVTPAGDVDLISKSRVEQAHSVAPVLFPSISANQAGINVAWEDREAGHTRLKHSFSTSKGASFSPPQYLNEFQSNRNQYDKGSGVTRVSLAAIGADEVIATWMDKRRGNAGYGIFAALGSEDSFGPNEKVHGQKGDTQPHYNPATAGDAKGDFVVAWDDFREGNSDIWLSSYNGEGEWTQDHAPPPASGPAEQTHASVAIDAQGNLHLVWLERSSPNAPTRLWYSRGVKE